MKSNPYDELYKQIDMREKPFGYTIDYLLWRTGKLKRPWAKFIQQDSRILDVGGGFGIMAHFLPDFVDRKNYYNLDISLQMLKYSPYNNILAAAEAVPFGENSFDYVVSSDALEHVNNKIGVLTECYRVLKPGGLFFLSTPRTGWIDDFRKSPFRVFLRIDMVLNMLHPRKSAFAVVPKGVKDEPSDEEWLKATLQNIGFSVLEQYRADNHVPWGKAGESKFWRWFADKFVEPEKYGHCTIAICTKYDNKTG